MAPTAFFGDYGCHVRIAEEISALHEHGVETTLVTYPFGRDLAGVDIRRSPRLLGPRLINPGSSMHKYALDAALAASALRLAAVEPPDLVHGHLHEGALIGWLVARARRVPLVFDFQGSLTAEMIDHGFLARGGLAYSAFRSIENWVVRHSDMIVTSTSHGADVLMREFGRSASTIEVVPDSVNASRFVPLCDQDAAGLASVARLRSQLGIEPGKQIIVYLGLLAEYQGITHLLRAAETLLKRRDDVHFLVMGFPGEDRYRILAKRLGIDRSVTFTGAVRYEDSAQHLALGTIAVSPKLSQTEGNGKLLNYIAMGLPTVTFDTSVNREILGDLGVYAPYGDWTALAIEIEGLLDAPASAAARGRQLRHKAIKEHNWTSAVETLIGVYQRVLGT